MPLADNTAAATPSSSGGGPATESARVASSALLPSPPVKLEEVATWVDRLLEVAIENGACDVHFSPTPDVMRVAWRVDGVLAEWGTLPKAISANVVSRFKVLADLLTYRQDTPQEGRLKIAPLGWQIRVSSFPTLFGERLALRLLGESHKPRLLADLGYAPDVDRLIQESLAATSGVLLFCGPAGSGKTTSAYAFLRSLQQTSFVLRSLLTLEDPVESVLPGVVQSAVNASNGFTYPVGLRSLLRQDPDVILVGEIRDRETVETVFQAGLTGHLVVSTFHAGSAGEALQRLGEMGLPGYVLRSALQTVVAQRLVRRRCVCLSADGSSGITPEHGVSAGLTRTGPGCPQCRHSGYLGRMPIAEVLCPQWPAVADAVLQRRTPADLNAAARLAGFVTLWTAGLQAVQRGETTLLEVQRVLSGSATPEDVAAAQLDVSTARSVGLENVIQPAIDQPADALTERRSA